MTIIKAIEILLQLKDAGIDAGHYDAEDAIDLGIEALKRIKQQRMYCLAFNSDTLPGETPV